MNEINNRYGLGLDCVTKYDLRNTFRRKAFWLDYFFVTEAKSHHRYYPEFGESVRLPVKEYAGLNLNIDLSFDEVSLSLYHSSLKDLIELGWDNRIRSYPYVFKWGELEKVYHALENQFPEKPKIPLLLLFRFATVTKDEDLEKARRQLEEAWRSLDLFSEAEIRDLMDVTAEEHWEFQRESVFWVHHPVCRWVMEGKVFSVHSLRVAKNDRFPFDLLQDVIQHGLKTTE